MADVRSMLRAERASRRITHPHASYTTDGKLLCNLCDSLVKAEPQWQSHLHSTQHRLRSQRAQDAATSRASEGTNKKRKASSIDSSPNVDERKRTKASAPTSDDEGDALERNGTSELAEGLVQAQPVTTTNDITASTPAAAVAQAVDEDEFAAFERELADLEATAEEEGPASTVPSALNASATISAAPMTAEQLAAQAREEQSAQRGRRDVELEEEKDEAARLLQEEFDEMEGLEERARRLRQRREALRNTSVIKEDFIDHTAREIADDDADGVRNDGDEEDDEDVEDDADVWGFGNG